MIGNEKLDKWDYIVAVSSGALMAGIDILFVKALDLNVAHQLGQADAEKLILSLAKRSGYKGNELSGALQWIEKKNPFISDSVTNEFGGGKQHHLRDFAHHPSRVGLICSILEQFTGYAFGTDVKGRFKAVAIPGWEKPDIFTGILSGTFGWVMHLISDLAGSSASAVKESLGTGLPGPLLSLLKEISAVPPVQKLTGDNKDGYNSFSIVCSKLFNGTLLGEHDAAGKIVKGGERKFDFRTELGLVHEAFDNKQHIPVILCELIVSAFYSVRRLIDELSEKRIETINDLNKIDFISILPWNSRRLTHMRMLSSTTFSAMDITAAGVKAYLKSDGDKRKFAVEFIQNVNLFGFGRFLVSTGGEIGVGISKLHENYRRIVEGTRQKLSLPANLDVKDAATHIVSTGMTIASMGTPLGCVTGAISTYSEVSKAIKEYEIAKEERIRIETECQQKIQILTDYREQIDLVANEYILLHFKSFDEGLKMMDEAIFENDSDRFIAGNVVIQEKLGRKDFFKSQNEFDTIMERDSSFKL